MELHEECVTRMLYSLSQFAVSIESGNAQMELEGFCEWVHFLVLPSRFIVVLGCLSQNLSVLIFVEIFI